MPRRGTLFALGAAALLAAALGALGYYTRSSLDGGAPALLQWHAGSFQRYAVSIDSSVLMTFGDGAPQPGSVSLDGRLDFRVLDVSSEGALVGMRLSAADLEISGTSDPATNQSLTQPFRVRYKVDGAPAALEFPNGLSAEHRKVLENLVGVFQITLRDGDTWTAQESNTSGTYEAVYARRSGDLIVKTKQRFLETSPDMGGTEMVVASSETIRIDKSRDWVAAMTVDEKMTTADTELFTVEITNHAELELLPLSAMVNVATPDIWDFAATKAPPIKRAPVEAAVLALSADEAEQEIRLAVQEMSATEDHSPTRIRRLRDLILVDDSLPFVLLDLLREDELANQTRADLYLVLELAGNPPAQAALSSVIEDTSWSPGDALRAIVALSDVATPTPEALQTLWNTALSGQAGTDRAVLQSSSVLALGNLGSTMRASDDPQYAAWRSNLLSGLTSASDDHMRSVYVRALGSTQDTSLRTDVVAMLDDRAPAVRDAAAETLGRLGPNEVADDLVRRFDRETDSTVRASIAEALVSWDQPTRAATESIQNAIRAERDEDARYKMAQFLGTHIESFPENRAVLRELLRSEQSERIRQSITEKLAKARDLP